MDVLDILPELTEATRGTVQTIGKLQKEIHIDELSYQTKILLYQLSAILWKLELRKVVKRLPGKKFRLAAY